jgi:hypothetical protein
MYLDPKETATSYKETLYPDPEEAAKTDKELSDWIWMRLQNLVKSYVCGSGKELRIRKRFKLNKELRIRR